MQSNECEEMESKSLDADREHDRHLMKQGDRGQWMGAAIVTFGLMIAVYLISRSEYGWAFGVVTSVLTSSAAAFIFGKKYSPSQATSDAAQGPATTSMALSGW